MSHQITKIFSQTGDPKDVCLLTSLKPVAATFKLLSVATEVVIVIAVGRVVGVTALLLLVYDGLVTYSHDVL